MITTTANSANPGPAQSEPIPTAPVFLLELENKNVDAGGKPSTWFPPEGLVEQIMLAREREQEQKREPKHKRRYHKKVKQGKIRSESKSMNTSTA